jgi:GNAT superfamily N-acetyltransferase
MVIIQPVIQESEELELIKILFQEYSSGLNEDLCFQCFDKELQNPLKKYGEPKGAVFIAFTDNKPAGCIALQPLKKEGVCEMKRLYVRDEFRKQGIADQLVSALLLKAKEKGYNKMVLDTLERLQPAIQLYVKHGFQNTSAYYSNPLPGVVYMEKDL